MIKNIIIVIILFLLLTVAVAYYTLASRMENFERERLQYVVSKEDEIKREKAKLVELTECNNNMRKYKNIIHSLSQDLTKSTTDINNITKNVHLTNESIKNDTKHLDGPNVYDGLKNN